MQTITSISGGKTSAYLAANYPADYFVFALVRSNDKKIAFKDRILAKQVEDRIGCEFIATVEDDVIINTIFDLELISGKEIKWVTGPTFEDLIASRGGYLPNMSSRYCTTHLKIEPIFNWWRESFNEPVIMNIGYRANETERAERFLEKCDSNKLESFRAIVGKSKDGNRNKWAEIKWRTPQFPLIEDQIFKDDVESFWMDKNVRFARRNNCVGCFHRNGAALRQMFEYQPEKMQWFANMERPKSRWRKDVNYQKVINLPLQSSFNFEDIVCDGECGT